MKSYEKYITKEGIEAIHEKSLEILENIGVNVLHQPSRDLLKKHGATIDGENVKLPRSLVEKMLTLAIPKFDIFSSYTDEPVTVGGGSWIIGPASSNIYINENGKIRKMTNRDVLNQFILSDTSPVINSNTINFVMETEGMSKEQIRYGFMAIALRYAHKPGYIIRPNMFNVEEDNIHVEYGKALEIMRRFHGLEKGKVFHIGSMNTLTPLALHGGQLEMLWAIVEAGQSCWITPCAMPLMTSPASISGTMAVTNAEVLMGYTIAKLIDPEAKILYGNTSGSTDMRTIQLTIGSPESALFCYATAAMADYYHLPFRTGGGLSDAKDCDIQAGYEGMLMVNASIDCGADYIHHGCGTIGAFNVVSFEKFLMDEEAIAFAKRMQRGINTDEKSFLMKDVEKAGPRGTYLSGRTPKIYRKEFTLPKYSNTQDPNQWQMEGSVSIREKLQNAVQERLDSYEVPELPKEQIDILMPYIPKEYRTTIK